MTSRSRQPRNMGVSARCKQNLPVLTYILHRQIYKVPTDLGGAGMPAGSGDAEFCFGHSPDL